VRRDMAAALNSPRSEYQLQQASTLALAILAEKLCLIAPGEFLDVTAYDPTQDIFDPEQVEAPKPKTVVLCGSTKFKDAFIEANRRETLAGRMVFSVGWFTHADGAIYRLTEAEKARVDELHLRKIDAADEVFVLNVGGYIGTSTRREIDYAQGKGKPIRYLEPGEE
jgi:hypothetical protein